MGISITQMDGIIPLGEWKTLVQPYYCKGERGNKAYELELMLPLFIPQNLYNLSDEGIVAEVIDCWAFSEFCGVNSSRQSTRWRYLGTVSESIEEAQLAATVACSSGRYADGMRIDSEKGY